MLKQLVDRAETKKTKSALIVTSSAFARIPMSAIISYCATKIFATYMCEGIHHEVAGKVDVISYEPAGVATKMIGRSKTDIATISPEAAVNGLCRDVGYERVTHGAFMHEFTAWAISGISQPMVSKSFIKDSVKVVDVMRENNEK